MNLFQRRAIRLEGYLVRGDEVSYLDEYGVTISVGTIGSDDAAIMRAFPVKTAAKILETAPALVDWQTRFDPEDENWTERDDVATKLCLR